MGNTPPKIFLSCFLNMKISLQPVNQFDWNLANLLADSFLTNRVRIFISLFVYSKLEYFFTGSASDSLSLSLTAYNKRKKCTWQKSETRCFSQTLFCKDRNLSFLGNSHILWADFVCVGNAMASANQHDTVSLQFTTTVSHTPTRSALVFFRFLFVRYEFRMF